MSSSEFETEQVRPVRVWCDESHVHVALADGREIGAPLWWYPFLLKASAETRAQTELEFAGIWWPSLDEGISVKALLLGWKAPGAISPKQAA